MIIRKYRGKAPIVEAVQVTLENLYEIANWGAPDIEPKLSTKAITADNPEGLCLVVENRFGSWLAPPGAWIVSDEYGLHAISAKAFEDWEYEELALERVWPDFDRTHEVVE